MSGIAGIFHFDGQPVPPGQIELMTSAMVRRGPDGLRHWRSGPVALGQCMFRTTPQSIEEVQPLVNEDGTLVLVMDGRVDNWEDLRRELLRRGALLRTRTDTELVLRAYEVWGDACVDHLVGECVFFLWDARRQRLFGARDAAGARHFYYCQGKGWFAFASEIKGLLALSPIERRLNESRLLDYLVTEFDRSDEVGTFYKDIFRLPAGHAMEVALRGQRHWRYWNPGHLAENRFSSTQECTEAFMDQLRVAVKCRLRSIKPVGAMLSGGLDSSSIVGLISSEFRSELVQPLRTFSLIREDRENCPDWRAISEILRADPWLQPSIITSAKASEVSQSVLSAIGLADEPFAVANGFTYGLTYEAGRDAGCAVMLDGMAGDALFYDPRSSADIVARRRLYGVLRPLLAAFDNHQIHDGLRYVLLTALKNLVPDRLRAAARRQHDRRQCGEGDMQVLNAGIARNYLASKRSPLYLAGGRLPEANDQMAHARNFTTGLISFGHEVYGPLALANGVEPRSPFSDRRLIEFAIQMPLSAKLAVPWYKHVLRSGTIGMLPESVRWRPDLGGHPGWDFFDRLAGSLATAQLSGVRHVPIGVALDHLINRPMSAMCPRQHSQSNDFYSEHRAFRLALLSKWVTTHKLVL